MDLGLKGKVAVVLASSKGMGFATAKALAMEGMKVAMCARSAGPLKQAAERVRRASKRPVFFRALNVEDRKASAAFISAVMREWGAIHVLVTNCGGPPPGRPLDITDAQWRDAVPSTLMVAIDWTRAVAPIMIRQRWGRIINITSLAVKQPIDNLILSNTMRAGVAGFAKTMSRELAPHGITVNTLCPGLIMTDRIRGLAEVRAKTGKISVQLALRAMEAEVPAGRIGSPDEFAAVAAFLAGEGASYVNGVTLQVDGGAYRALI